MEGRGGILEAGGGSADLGEAVLEEIDLEIGLLFEGSELLQAQLLHVGSPNRGTRRCGSLRASARPGRTLSSIERACTIERSQIRDVIGSDPALAPLHCIMIILKPFS